MLLLHNSPSAPGRDPKNPLFLGQNCRNFLKNHLQSERAESFGLSRSCQTGFHRRGVRGVVDWTEMDRNLP
jgi:hypothetical protein